MTTTHLKALLLGASILWPRPSASPAGLQGRLDETVENYEISEPDLARAVIAAASQFQIPMGIEWIESQPQHPVAMQWKRTTVRRVIDSIVKAQPGYEFEARGNIAHIFYAGAKADRGNFLNIKIRAVVLEHVHVGLARRKLEQIVWDTVSPPPPPLPGKPASWGGSVPLDPGDTAKSFRWENVEVRDALDELTLAGHYRVWAVSFPESGKRTPTGFRLTLSLWMSWLGPNSLPSWDLFDWDHQPPLPSKEPS